MSPALDGSKVGPVQPVSPALDRRRDRLSCFGPSSFEGLDGEP